MGAIRSALCMYICISMHVWVVNLIDMPRLTFGIVIAGQKFTINEKQGKWSWVEWLCRCSGHASYNSLSADELCLDDTRSVANTHPKLWKRYQTVSSKYLAWGEDDDWVLTPHPFTSIISGSFDMERELERELAPRATSWTNVKLYRKTSIDYRSIHIWTVS